MNVLLTGATGFIGARLIRCLLSHGHFVTILTRHVRSRDDRNVGQFYWDPSSPAPAEPIEWADALIHLAGEPVAQRWTAEAKSRIRESRVLGTRNLVEGITRCRKRPEVLVSASAIGFYGDRGDEILTEDSAPGSGFLPEVSLAWEHEADQADEVGLRVVKARIGIALGSEGGALKQMLPPFRWGLGGRLGSGNQWMSWIHAADLVELLVFAAITRSLRGPVNATSPNPLQNRDFTRMLGAALHRPTIFPVPQTALRVAFGEMSEVLLASQRVLPDVAHTAGFRFQYPQLDGAFREVLA